MAYLTNMFINFFIFSIQTIKTLTSSAANFSTAVKGVASGTDNLK